MTKEVIFTSLDASIENVAKLLIENNIHGIPVVEAGKPIGIITETDFFTNGSSVVYLPEYINSLRKDVMLGKISSNEKEKIAQLLSTTIKDIMSSPCLTIGKDDEISEFIRFVRERGVKSMPVVDGDGNLVGIVTMSDVIHLINIK